MATGRGPKTFSAPYSCKLVKLHDGAGGPHGSQKQLLLDPLLDPQEPEAPKPSCGVEILAYHLLLMTRRQKNNAVGIEALVLQRVHAGDRLALRHVDHRDRAVTHFRQIQETVLDKQVLLIGG